MRCCNSVQGYPLWQPLVTCFLRNRRGGGGRSAEAIISCWEISRQTVLAELNVMKAGVARRIASWQRRKLSPPPPRTGHHMQRLMVINDETNDTRHSTTGPQHRLVH